MDLSIVSVAALVTFDRNVCREARICLGTMGPTPLRPEGAEKFLKGKPLDRSSIAEAASIVGRESTPRSSLRASAEYRREIAGVLTAKALDQIENRKIQ